ncbi:MAG: hypothetical protein LGB67_03090 [Sulfurovum sp.]|nr:hypothetical protein [Sulfurovum sp.]
MNMMPLSLPMSGGCYYQDKFSRSDNTEDSYRHSDFLDIRFAFNGGWNTAFVAMALKDPVYWDTAGPGQSKSRGKTINIEGGTPNNTSGWFSEALVHRILYDLYDSGTDESFDTLSLGFGPMHKIMTGPQKNVGAFTSIFSFIALLKKARPYDADAIDKIVSHERIVPITDIFGGLDGNARTNHAADCPYVEATGSPVQSATVSVTTKYGIYNRLGNFRYVRFGIPTSDHYILHISSSNGSAGASVYQIAPSFKKVIPYQFYSGSHNMQVGDYFEQERTYLLVLGNHENPVDTIYTVTILQY